MDKKITPPSFEEYQDAVIANCKKSYPGDEVLMKYVESDEGEKDIRNSYEGACISLRKGMDPSHFLTSRVYAITYDLFMSA